MGFFSNPLKLHKKIFKAGQSVTGGLAKMDPLGSRLRKLDPLGSKLIGGGNRGTGNGQGMMARNRMAGGAGMADESSTLGDAFGRKRRLGRPDY